MNPALLFSASYHHADNIGWHALIFGLVVRVMRQLTLGQSVLLAAVVLAVMFLWAGARDRRRRECQPSSAFTRSASRFIAKGLGSTCMPWPNWPLPMIAASA